MRIFPFLFFALIIISCNNDNKRESETQTQITTQNISRKGNLSKNNSQKIIAGESVGNIIVEQDAAPIIDSLGKPDTGDAAMGKSIMTWNGEDGELLTIYTSQKMGVEDFSRIKAIRILSEKYKTEDNLGVNSPLADLKRYYRLDYAGKFAFQGKHYILYSTNKGIAFEVGMNQKCHGVLIYPENSQPTDLYLPIYADYDFHEK